MTSHIFKHRRRVDGKLKVSRLYYGRYRITGGALTTVPLKTTDKQVAAQRLRKIVEGAEMESAGIGIPKALRLAAAKPILEHLNEYVGNLSAQGRDEMYVYNIEKWISRLVRECSWGHLRDVTADSFTAWRARNSGKAPKTLNQYLDATRGFMKWLLEHERVLTNPLTVVGKAETRGKERRKRRALTADEMRRLLNVAGPRKVIYLLAVFTGLRRAEIGELRKGDFHLYGDNPYVRARAATTKNHKEATLWLHPEVVDELRKVIPKAAAPDEPAFECVPPMEQFRVDLMAARIPFEDEDGRRADFHALRHTLATNLTLAGVSPRVAMEFMRHSDLRLTHKTYTDASLLPLAEAVEKLPRFTKDDTQIRTQSLGTAVPEAASDGTESETGDAHESLVTVGESHVASLSGAEWQKGEVVPRLGLEPRTN